MEEKEGLNGSGITVRGDEVPQGFRVEPRVETSGQLGGSTSVAPPPAPPATVAATTATTEVRKKRGRPRKYVADGSAAALSPMPISASVPLAGDYSAWKNSSGRPVDSLKKKQKLDSEGPVGTMPFLGGSFTPHMITVNAGEDISMKVIAFSQEGSRAICILAASGAVSNVTLRQTNSCGGTLTYEGRFDILSLTGSFIPCDIGLAKGRSGGMSVTLAGPDGRVVGGGLAGMLVAAGPVQVVIGSFLPPGHQDAQKAKKARYEQTISFGSGPANPISEERHGGAAFSGPRANLTTSTSFHGDSTSLASMHGSKVNEAEKNDPLPGEYSREQNHEIAC